MATPIDLRSDTVTRPTEAMRAAMAGAEVGDDVYGEDPTVRALEERVAALFGHEAALFTATGSLANVLAVRGLVAPGQEVLCESAAHIARAELGAHGAVSGITMRTWSHPRGQVDLDALEHPVRARPRPVPGARPRRCRSRTPTTSPAGAVLPADDLDALRAWADAKGVRVHLDGARIWNAHVATGVPLERYGAAADVLCVCLSKGLGAPVGSLVVGPADLLAEARVWRKRLGGGMRQAGILAAAGLHALDHHVERLAEDHEHARLLAEACGVDPATVDTNIVVVPSGDAAGFVAAARDARRARLGGRGADRPAGHPPRRVARGRRGSGAGPGRGCRAGSARVAVEGDLADGGVVACASGRCLAGSPRPGAARPSWSPSARRR